MSDGELAYITKRMDRGPKGQKYSMLDMCQLTNRLTEHKYLGSYSQLSAVVQHLFRSASGCPALLGDCAVFVDNRQLGHALQEFLIDFNRWQRLHPSPAYDLLAVLLTGIEDKDELAMPLEGSGTEGREA